MSLERPILFSYFDKTAKVLLAEFSRSAEQNAADNLGSNREVFCSKFLSGVLPARLTVSSGEIWDSKRSKTGQLDLIVVRNDAVSLEFSGNRKSYLAEGVFAVIEGKSNLNREKLVEAGYTLKRVSCLNILPMTGVSLGKYRSLDRPLRIVFSYDGATFETLVSEIEKHNWQDLFDLVCILNRGVLISSGRLVKHPSNPVFHRFKGRAATLGFLWFYLVTYGSTFTQRTWDHKPYLETLIGLADDSG